MKKSKLIMFGAAIVATGVLRVLGVTSECGTGL
jgi:hypothetical protein